MRIGKGGFCVVLAASAILLAAESGHNLFQKGLAKERAEADLRGAIRIYEQVVRQNAKDHKLAAQALFRIGECQQALGDKEASKVYERLVRDYPDQSDLVGQAQARLSAMRAVPAAVARQGGMALRKVWTTDTSGGASTDGRRLTYVDNHSRLLLHDLATGTDRVLTSSKDGGANVPAISRDGTQVAYGWRGANGNVTELRIASLLGNGMPPGRRLFGNQDVSDVRPLDWSPDGKWIAVGVERKDRTAQIALVAVQDGSLRVLKSVEWSALNRIFFSPDGRDLAVDLPANGTSGQHDVFLLAVDGSRQVPAVVHQSNDTVMGWTPDGKHLLFASDRSGSRDLWAIAVADKSPIGAPELVKADIGGSSMGVTSDGSLYLGAYTGNREIEVATIDLETGKITVPPVRPVQSFIGSNSDPAWSRDGKYLAYVSRRGSSGGNVIAIRSVDTGEVRELQPKPEALPSFFNGLSWAPDGRSFAVNGYDPKGRNGVFRIDAHTGEVVPIVMPAPEVLSYEGFFWSPDAKRIYYHSQMGTIYERDLASGNQREVIREGGLGPISLSPDGRWIAASRWDPSKQLRNVVVLIPVEGGEPRELLRLGEPHRTNNNSMAWTPDSRGVLVRKMLTADDKTSELWLVPISGGPPRKLDFDANRVIAGAPGKIRLHPDGRQVAYVTGEYGLEVWVLENFLPVLNVRK